MNKLAGALSMCALSLWAADFWVSKPFTEWNDHDVQRMATNSPWAKQVNVIVSMGSGGGGRGRSRGNAAGDIGDSGVGNGGADSGFGGAGGGGGGGRGRAGSTSSLEDGIGGANNSIPVTVRWQTAMPVKQALLRARYGSEAATAPEAKKALATEESNYIIAVAGVPGMVRDESESFKKMLLSQTTISVRGKDPILAADVKFIKDGRAMDAFFAFPKKDPVTLEDKEVDFSTKLGTINIHQKFRLKDMVFNGKLEL
jgi:hypothetical protein